MTPAPSRPSTHRLAAFVLLALPLACALVGSGALPQQGWRRDRGPVVPHDTFPTDCALCHLTDGWHSIRPDFHFDHAAQAGVPLHGAHRDAQCLRCHNDRGPVARFAARGCAGCHADPHQGRLGRDTCTACHREDDWVPRGQVAEHASTRFPLVGAHAAVACYRCHPGAQVGNFQRADTRCETCHRQDLARAVDPDHRAQGWTTDCQECHSPTLWLGARVDHGFFPLTGAHAGATCRACHQGGFQGTPRQCIGCHQDDYDRAPDHRALSFPTGCEDCHDTSRWQSARFDHRFPRTRDHAVACTTCHDRGSTTTFNCIGCHAHRRSEMDDEHDDVRDYVYESGACYQCHPNGDR